MISRSGALTVAEVSVCGVPVIFIPFPEAAENHQYYNAMAVAEKGGAIVIEEKDLDSKPLTKQIEKVRGDRRLREDMAHGCKACGSADAVKVICDTIFEDIKK